MTERLTTNSPLEVVVHKTVTITDRENPDRALIDLTSRGGMVSIRKRAQSKKVEVPYEDLVKAVEALA